MRHVYDFVVEPRGKSLQKLVSALGDRCAYVMVVIRDDLGLCDTANSVLSRIGPDVVERIRSSTWPGTTLIGSEATIIRFRPSAVALEGVLSAAEGLYDWQQPVLPEDLCFLRNDGSALFASISHEGDAFLDVDDEEYEALVRDVPELPSIVRRRQEGA